MKKVGKNILKGVIYLIIPIIIELLFSKKVILEKSTLIRLAMLYGIEILYFGYFIINKYKEKHYIANPSRNNCFFCPFNKKEFCDKGVSS